ncbi:hypothetical protein HC024_20455 [Methylococcaceae bacterium WWC4]|nr:hypothetical protein [Methylococcaceae bacterium WWC4]
MTDSKLYLNVPYAQKDAAKALGARWDAAAKKWYVPAGKDPAIFAQWTSAELGASPAKPAKSSPPKSSSGNATVTLPTIADFVPYDGDEPPWNP